jgi:cyanate permease
MVVLTFATDLLVSRGLSLQAAGGVAALLMLFPITASTAMGHLLDRHHLQNAGAAAACLLLAVCVILLGTNAAPAVPLIIAMSVAMALAPSAVFATAPYLMRDQQSGLGYGVLAGMLNIGVALGPVVAGAAKDATGSYLASCVAAAVLEVLGALAVLLLRGVPRTEAA